MTQEKKEDILVVASKLKKYIREQSGMNTSANVMVALSEQIRKLCDNAIVKAKNDGRKTVMDRDFELERSSSSSEYQQGYTAAQM